MSSHIPLKVKDLEGNILNLSEAYPDKPLLLVFYNNQCLGCTGRALPFAYTLKNDFPGVEVIGIHCDFTAVETTGEEIIGIFTSGSLPFPIYKDIDLKLYNGFECEGTPHWILLNKKGDIENSVFGSQQGSQNRLVYALEELGAQKV